MRIKHNPIIWFPLVIATSIVLGIIIGDHISTKKFITDKDRKINTVLNLIESEYVDTLSIKDLVELTIPKIISNLDPHSYYIPSSDVKATDDELNGSFSGIGITFNMMNDTANVVEVIPNGPAEKAGILAGDRIVSVNDSTTTGSKVSSEKVKKWITGAKDSTVKIGIKRNSSKKILYYNVKRGDIPVTSVDAAYMIDKTIGYVKVNKFGRNTYDEFLTAIAQLQSNGADKYIVDLRGNAGGFMEMATLMVNEFLSKGELIVYTKGRDARDNIQVWSDNSGSFHDAQIAVLIDEYSASASEIFAGAIQDNDRGLIIGRRSFGKGLVQKQTYLPDSSAIRLTTARYYTPSGRCVQKDYKSGDDKYSMELYDRYSHGEIYNADSIKTDEKKIFKTANGRTVYGGGGIIPDIFVPNDTVGISSYYIAVANMGLLHKFSFKYTDLNRDKLLKYKDINKLLKALPSDESLTYDFVMFARDNGVPVRWYYISQSRKLIAKQLKAMIARDILGIQAQYQVLNQTDTSVATAVKALKRGDAVPPVTLEITKHKTNK